MARVLFWRRAEIALNAVQRWPPAQPDARAAPDRSLDSTACATAPADGVACSVDQGCFVVRHHAIDVDAGLDQPFDHRLRPQPGRDDQGIPLTERCPVGIGAELQ